MVTVVLAWGSRLGIAKAICTTVASGREVRIKIPAVIVDVVV